jgi:hypothetical protein
MEREPVFEDDPYSFTMKAIRDALRKGLLNTDDMSDGEASVLGELNATLFKLDPTSAVVFGEGEVEGG